MIKKMYLPLVLAASLSFGAISMTNAHVNALYGSEELIGGPPYAKVCGKTEGKVERSELLNMEAIELGGCVKAAEVTSFKMTVTRSGADGSSEVVVMLGEGDTLTEKMKAVIKALPDGSKVYFEDIKVEDGTGRPYDIKPVVVTIG